MAKYDRPTPKTILLGIESLIANYELETKNLAEKDENDRLKIPWRIHREAQVSRNRRFIDDLKRLRDKIAEL